MPESYLESYLNFSEPWCICKIRNLCFVSINLFFAATRHALIMPPAASEKIRQQHPAAASCNGTNMPTPKRTHYFNRSTLKQHPAAAPAGQLQSGHATPTAAPCSSSSSRSSSVQQHPSLAPLPGRVGYITYPPCSTLKHHLCSSISRLARQHPQAAPSTRIRSPVRPLQNMVCRTRITLTAAPSSITFRQHLQQHPERHQHARSKLYTPPWQQATPCTSTLQAALQRHHHARPKVRTPLWQQHAQRQQHASSKAPHVWYNNYRILPTFETFWG